MRFRHILALALALCSLVESHTIRNVSADEQEKTLQQERDRQTQLLNWLDSADPKVDVRRAIGKGDYRFLGCMGFALQLPGLPNDVAARLPRGDIRVIEGTSDYYAAARLQELARQYAATYNKLMWQYLHDHHLQPK